jgi:hypothetical protein
LRITIGTPSEADAQASQSGESSLNLKILNFVLDAGGVSLIVVRIRPDTELAMTSVLREPSTYGDPTPL